MTKLKTLVVKKLNFAKIAISLVHTVENTVRKGENTGYQHFLLFSQCFPKPSSLQFLSVKCGKDLTLYSIDTFINASTTDSFGKHCGKRRNCS